MSDKRENNITRTLLVIAIVLSVIALIRSTKAPSTNVTKVHNDKSLPFTHTPNNTNEINVPDEWKGSFGRHYSSEEYLRSIGGVTRDDIDHILEERKYQRSIFDHESLRPSSPTPASHYFKDTVPTSSYFSESAPASSYFND